MTIEMNQTRRVVDTGLTQTIILIVLSLMCVHFAPTFRLGLIDLIFDRAVFSIKTSSTLLFHWLAWATHLPAMIGFQCGRLLYGHRLLTWLGIVFTAANSAQPPNQDDFQFRKTSSV